LAIDNRKAAIETPCQIAGKVLSYRPPTEISVFFASRKEEVIPMDYTYEQLKHKTVAELREIAKGNEHEALQGYTQLNKEHLLVAISKALGIKHEHHEVVGVDKASIKARIREMKQHRDDAIAAHDHAKLKVARRTIHRLKRQIHKATV
jgi:Rho termination factor, N-terminal domain.